MTDTANSKSTIRILGRRVRLPWLIGHVSATIFIISLIGCCIVFPMPGKSWHKPLPAMTPQEQALSSALKTHVEVLAAQIGERHLGLYDKLEQAAGYVESQLAAGGIQPKSLPYDLDAKRPRNIELELPGNKLKDEIVIIGAHYDSAYGTPAANDNASGVAALIELARIMKDLPRERTIRFVAFVNEEPPWFQSEDMGSMVYARACRKRGDNITGMLALETIGYYRDEPNSQSYPISALGWFYPKRGNFIGFIGSTDSRDLVRRTVGSFRGSTQFPCEGIAAPQSVPGVGWSDHWSFWKTGYPALMVTDTAPFRYPHYHSTQDTPDKIDYDRMARVVAGLARVIEDLAK